MKEGIEGLTPFTSVKSPSINKTFCTIVLNNIFEDDANNSTVLNEA